MIDICFYNPPYYWYNPPIIREIVLLVYLVEMNIRNIPLKCGNWFQGRHHSIKTRVLGAGISFALNVECRRQNRWGVRGFDFIRILRSMPQRSIKPGCRVSAIPSRARADIPMTSNAAGAPPSLPLSIRVVDFHK